MILWILLFLPILARVFWIHLAMILLPFRKEGGILMGSLAIVHALKFILPSYPYLSDPAFWSQKTLAFALGFWFLALLITIPLTLTSNTLSMKKLGKYWKKLHRLAYVLVFLVVLHVLFLQWNRWHVDYGIIALFLLFCVWKWMEWRGVQFYKKSSI